MLYRIVFIEKRMSILHTVLSFILSFQSERQRNIHLLSFLKLYIGLDLRMAKFMANPFYLEVFSSTKYSCTNVYR